MSNPQSNGIDLREYPLLQNSFSHSSVNQAPETFEEAIACGVYGVLALNLPCSYASITNCLYISIFDPAVGRWPAG